MARGSSTSATSRPKKLAGVKAKLMSSTCVASIRYGNGTEITVLMCVNRSAFGEARNINMALISLFSLKLRANGSNIDDQQLPPLLNVTCCVCLHTLLHVVGCSCVLLRKV